jgi:hypothetical protein
MTRLKGLSWPLRNNLELHMSHSLHSRLFFFYVTDASMQMIKLVLLPDVYKGRAMSAIYDGDIAGLQK